MGGLVAGRGSAECGRVLGTGGAGSMLGGLVARANIRVASAAVGAFARLKGCGEEDEGQGTTEYAILVGVLVVIAIGAIVLFRGRIQELWDSIATAINGL